MINETKQKIIQQEINAFFIYHDNCKINILFMHLQYPNAFNDFLNFTLLQYLMEKQITAKAFQTLNKPTIWQKVVALTQQTKGISLSQGTPSFGPQPFFIENMQKAAKQCSHQYIPVNGTLELRKSIAKYHSRQYKSLDPNKHIFVTAGATAALYCLFLATLSPGDQVILFQPAFDYYRHYATLLQVKINYIPLTNNKKKSRQQLSQMLINDSISSIEDWQIDFQKFQSCLSEKVKLIIINSPHNPTGKVFTLEELDKIINLALKYQNIVLAEDNVYEGFQFDEFQGKLLPKCIHSKHYQTIKDRVINIYSAGKLLQATGIRTGWVISQNEQIIKALASFHQIMVFCGNDMIQKAIHFCLEDIISEKYYYLNLEAAKLQFNRKILLQCLAKSKYDFQVAVPKSGYFVLVDISKVQIKEKYFYIRLEDGTNKNSRDMAFCYQMAFQDGVIIVPCSTFFAKERNQQRYVRFAICKDLQSIRQAGKRIEKIQQSIDK